jgi:putative endonuclease
MSINAWVYILLCADDSFYVGSHRGEDVAVRVAQHQAGEGGDYTRRRLPVSLAWAENFQQITDAIAMERRIKGWSRAKKEALIRGDWSEVVARAKRRGGAPRPSRPASRAPQDEVLVDEKESSS